MNYDDVIVYGGEIVGKTDAGKRCGICGRRPFKRHMDYERDAWNGLSVHYSNLLFALLITGPRVSNCYNNGIMEIC